MKKLLLGYIIKFLIGAIALGLGIWYLSSSLRGDSISYISLDNFMNAIGATDGNIASANGCFMCRYVNDLFVVLGVAAEKFWNAILENLWVLMVVGFGIFLFVHTIKFFYKAMNDAVATIGSKISDGSSGGSGGSSKSNGASGSKGNSASGKSSTGDSGGASSSTSGDGFAPGVGGTAPKTNRYKYAQLEWLAGEGKHHIDTRVLPTNTTGIKVKFKHSGAGGQFVVGVVTKTNNTFGVRVPGKMFLPFDEDRTAGGDVAINVANNFDYEVSINYKNDRKRYVNGISKLDISNTLSADSTGLTICLFVEGGHYGDAFSGKVYYLQITEGQSLVRNLVPAQQIIEGEPKGVVGMYDLVSHEFYPGLSIGKFIAGPIVGYLEKIQES